MKDFGCPPVFPPEEDEPEVKEKSDVIIKDKSKGKKVGNHGFFSTLLFLLTESLLISFVI